MRTLVTCFVVVILSLTASAQPVGMEVGQVLIVNTSGVKTSGMEAHKAMMQEASTTWAKGQPGIGFAHFFADRGKENGGHMLVASIRTIEERKNFPKSPPFAGPKAVAVMTNPSSYTEYHLIGSETVKVMPLAGIMGMHYIKVKKNRSEDFEKFVTEKLNPALSQLFPDMQMLYYKAVAGDARGTYLTLWTIKSIAARDKYWPEGKPETEALKAGYAKQGMLAAELEDYLVNGSYLEKGKGAAAIFESKEWTDYVLQ
jgi:hypothetical protein